MATEIGNGVVDYPSAANYIQAVPTMNLGALSVNRLNFSFAGGDAVLRDVSFAAQPQEFVTLVGPSGCGKTTLLRLAAGLLEPDSGAIELDGVPVLKSKQSVGVVFQNDRLLPWKRVVDNVAIVLETRGISREEAKARACQQLNIVGLEGAEEKYPHQLSGGMRQRVNLARALVISPNVVLLDEPFAALDAQTREFMQAELLSIWQKNRATVLLVTHQLDEAVFLSDRVVVLGSHPGRVLDVVDVPFARPRSLDLKHDPKFHEVTDVIWRLIKDEVQANLLT
jgi:NitT/TauT family transport system ATP-binding protein